MFLSPRAEGLRRFVIVALILVFRPTEIFAANVDGSTTETTRIVSLVPSLTQSLFEIGARDEVAGVSDFCSIPPEATGVQKVGGLLNPNVERIILLKPDFVLLYRTQAETSARFERLGIRTRMFATDNVRDVSVNLAELGKLTGKDTEAKEAAKRMQRELDDIRGRVAGRPRVRALVVVSRDSARLRNIYAATPRHFLGELLEVAGGENILDPNAPPGVSVERIIETDPAVIIDATGPEVATSTESVDNSITRSAGIWSDLTTVHAVREHRVIWLTDPRAAIPGTYAPEIAQQIMRALHPDMK